MATTPNYGFFIPEADDSDLMDADLWRTPITQIDTSLKAFADARQKITSSMANKSMHRQNYPGGSTDANGFITINHTAGFTPTAALAINTNPSGSFAVVWGIGAFAAGTAQVRFMDARTGGAYASAATGAFTVWFYE